MTSAGFSLDPLIAHAGDPAFVIDPVEDRFAGAKRHAARLDGVGGGNGLIGMRERLERAGGTMQAGPTDAGWRVDLDVPA